MRKNTEWGALLIAVLFATLYFMEVPGIKSGTNGALERLFASMDSDVPEWAIVPTVHAAKPVTVAPEAQHEPAPEVKKEPAKYTVKSGDALMRLFPDDWKAICELNKLQSCNRIEVGEVLVLIEGVEVVAHKVVMRLADGSLPIARLAVDPYGPYRTPEKDRKILRGRGYSPAEIDEYLSLRSEGKCVSEEFSHGTKFFWMSHGNAAVHENLKAVWKQPEKGLVCQLSSGRNVGILDRCENLTEVARREPQPVAKPAVVVPEPDADSIATVEQPPVAEPEDVFPVHAKEGDSIPCNLQLGAGVYTNRVYKGDWGYGEGLCYVFKNGEWQHGPGFYAMVGGGESRTSTYANKESGIGLQYGVQRNFTNDRGRPSTFEVKARLLADHMWGSNSEGYWVDQKDLKFGLYTSYYEKHGENLVGVIGEYWKSFNPSVKSSWSGQQAQDRGSLGIYGVYERPLGDSGDWRLRLVGGAQHTNWDQQNWLRATAEFRYQEWLMFGPQVSLPIGISTANQPLTHGDLTTFGAFIRVELGNEVRENDAKSREGQLEFIPAGEVASQPRGQLEFVPTAEAAKPPE